MDIFDKRNEYIYDNPSAKRKKKVLKMSTLTLIYCL